MRKGRTEELTKKIIELLRSEKATIEEVEGVAFMFKRTIHEQLNDAKHEVLSKAIF